MFYFTVIPWKKEENALRLEDLQKFYNFLQRPKDKYFTHRWQYHQQNYPHTFETNRCQNICTLNSK